LSDEEEREYERLSNKERNPNEEAKYQMFTRIRKDEKLTPEELETLRSLQMKQRKEKLSSEELSQLSILVRLNTDRMQMNNQHLKALENIEEKKTKLSDENKIRYKIYLRIKNREEITPNERERMLLLYDAKNKDSLNDMELLELNILKRLNIARMRSGEIEEMESLQRKKKNHKLSDSEMVKLDKLKKLYVSQLLNDDEEADYNRIKDSLPDKPLTTKEVDALAKIREKRRNHIRASKKKNANLVIPLAVVKPVNQNDVQIVVRSMTEEQPRNINKKLKEDLDKITLGLNTIPGINENILLIQQFYNSLMQIYNVAQKSKKIQNRINFFNLN
jgi:hypothetical protein